MSKTFDERFTALIQRLEKSFTKNTQELEIKIDKNIERYHETNTKFIQELREKQQINFERTKMTTNRLIEEVNQKMVEQLKVALKIKDTLFKDIEKKNNKKNQEEKERFPQIMVKENNPKTFLPEFMSTGRLDFMNHFFESKWGSKYRGDRFGSCWEYDESLQKYIPISFEILIPKMKALEDEKILLTCEGPGGYNFYNRNVKWFGQAEIYMNRESLQKFLTYMHSKLPRLRNTKS